jgi:hypothetical protein
VEVNDGRYVIEHEAPYDAIICTLLLPQQEGTANIYSRDFFLAAKKRLAPRGRFCLWLPMHQLSPHLAGIVFHTFLSAFPNAVLIRGNFSHDTPTIGLIGARDLVDLSDTFLRARLSSLAGKAPVQQSVFFRSASNARLCLVGDLRAVATDFATDAETTDDHPVFAFDGPAPTTATELLRGFRLLEFVGKRFREPDFPSCLVPDGEKPDLLQHVRAANFLYAAGVSLNYPAKDEGERRRLFDAAQKEAATAYNLCPDLDLKRDDLGR